MSDPWTPPPDFVAPPPNGFVAPLTHPEGVPDHDGPNQKSCTCKACLCMRCGERFTTGTHVCKAGLAESVKAIEQRWAMRVPTLEDVAAAKKRSDLAPFYAWSIILTSLIIPDGETFTAPNIGPINRAIIVRWGARAARRGLYGPRSQYAALEFIKKEAHELVDYIRATAPPGWRADADPCRPGEGNGIDLNYAAQTLSTLTGAWTKGG